MAKDYGTTRDAINTANSEIQKYSVGDFIRIREYKGGDDPAIETVCRVKQITMGSCGLFSSNPPVFIVEDIKTGAESNLIRFSDAHWLNNTHSSACVWPFAFYNHKTQQYDSQYNCFVHGGSGSIQIWKLDNVAAKEAITDAFAEKRRVQEWQRQQEEIKKEKEKQENQRQEENKRITASDLNSLLNNLRE